MPSFSIDSIRFDAKSYFLMIIFFFEKSGKSSEDNRLSTIANMCMVCGRVARDQNELENHMLTHSGDKSQHSFKCDLSLHLKHQQNNQFFH